MKLYWRVKINGKWTWRPLTDEQRRVMERFERDFAREEE